MSPHETPARSQCLRSGRIAQRCPALSWGFNPSAKVLYGRGPFLSWTPDLTVTPAPAPLPDVVSSAFHRVEEDAMKAVAHFHTWWASRNLDDPEHAAIVTNARLVDFFNVCRPGFLALTFVSLGKLFDRRGLGLSKLGDVLDKHSFTRESNTVRSIERANQGLVQRVREIRNKSVSHNQPGMSRDDVYKTYGVTPDEIRDLVEQTRQALNDVGRALGFVREISHGNRQERAVNEVLRKLAQD